MKTYQLFLAFALVGVITTVVSFQTIHLVQEHCDQTHFCHQEDDHGSEPEDTECTRVEASDEECPICELKLPLLSPIEKGVDSSFSACNFDNTPFSYSQPRPDCRLEVNHLRGPPQNS
ncbi:hypothetical protein [Halocola ammonii]